jgi:polygalacturonase
MIAANSPWHPWDAHSVSAEDTEVIADNTTNGRDLSDRFGEVLNAQDFGATGDGSTDDTAACQACLEAADGSNYPAYFPAGTYRLTTGLEVKSDTIVNCAPGCIFKRDFSAADKFADNAATVSLYDMGSTISGADDGTLDHWENVTWIGGEFIAADSGDTGTHIMFRNVTNLVLRDVKVTSYHGDWAVCVMGEYMDVFNVRIEGGDAALEDGLHVMGGQYIRVHGCNITSGDDALAITNSHNIDIKYVTVDNCVLRSSDGRGLSLGSNWSTTYSDSDHVCEEVTVSNCVIVGNVAGIECTDDHDSLLTRSIYISNCAIETSGTPSVLGHGIVLNGCKDVHITNIGIRDPYRKAVQASICLDLTIQNISFDTCRIAGAHAGMFLTDCRRVLIDGMMAHDPKGDAIDLQGCQDATITNCTGFDIADSTGLVVIRDGDLDCIANTISGNNIYTWVESPATAGEYYLTLTSGKTPTSEPELTIADKPEAVLIDSVSRSEGTVGSLADNEWDWGDNDSLGYNTIYVHLPDDGGTPMDPNDQANGYIERRVKTEGVKVLGNTVISEASSGMGVRLVNTNVDHVLIDDNDFTGVTGDVLSFDSYPDNVVIGSNNISTDGTRELTISSGAITIGMEGFYTVDTESDDASDDLTTIQGAYTYQIVTLMAAHDARTVVCKHGTGANKLELAGGADFSLDNDGDTIVLVFNGTNWFELSRSSNHA